MGNLWWNSLKLAANGQMTHSLWKTLVWVLEMHYSYVSAYPWFYPFGLAMALSMCYLSWFRTFPFCIEISWLFHTSLYHGSLENKLTLDLSRYIWKSSVGDTSCCNFISHCQLSIIVPEILKMGNLWWNSLKLGGNDQMTHCFSKNLVWSSGNAL